MSRFNHYLILLLCVALVALVGCYPQPGPDKAVTGTILGGAWGAGAGAVAGHQIGHMEQGALIGAGLGAGSGLAAGGTMDIAEAADLRHRRELEELQIRVAANQRALLALQQTLDDRERKLRAMKNHSTVLFERGESMVGLSSAVALEYFVEAVKLNPFVGTIELHGYADDFDNEERNLELSEKRTKEIAAFLVKHGVSADTIQTFPHGNARNSRNTGTNDDSNGVNQRVEIILTK